MSVCKRVLVLVLYWTQCLPQGADAPPAMLRGCMTGFPQKIGACRLSKWRSLCGCPGCQLDETEQDQVISLAGRDSATT